MNKENLGCSACEVEPSQALNQTNGIPKLYHANDNLQDYYEFTENPDIYEVYCEVKSNGVYSAEFEITKLRFINIQRNKGIAPENLLVGMSYTYAALDRLDMVSKLNNQFLHSEAVALAAYLKIKYKYDCEIRKIDLPITELGIFDLASNDAIECPNINTICLAMDKEDTGLDFSVMAYYEVCCPLPFVFNAVSSNFLVGGVK